MLHRYMSEPAWTPAQEQEADRVCAAVESELEGALGATRITPVDWTETVPVTRDGVLDTTYPVLAVLGIGGVEIAEGDPLPDGYVLREGHLVMTDTAGALDPLGALGWTTRTGTPPPDPPYTGAWVALHYRAGWGEHPALVEAILAKAAIRMGNRHADTMVISGMTAAPPPPAPSRGFTLEELERLGRFRRLGWAPRR